MRVDLKEHRGLLILFAGTAALLAGATVVDIPLTRWLGSNGWPAFCEIMGQSLFAGEGPGGGDPAVFFIIGVVGIYTLSLLPKAPERIVAWRPTLGFMVIGSGLTALITVHALKWLVARARPYLVFEGLRPFSNWYEIGPHFITEGVYHGSFTSGHTTQVFVLMALAYALAGSPFAGRGRKTIGWLVGILATGYALVMGLARCMTLAHWVTDIAGSIAMSWVTLHLLYYTILDVPRQQRDREALGRSGELRAGWELKLVFYLAAAISGLAMGGIGLRALGIPEARWMGILLVPGFFLAAWGLFGSSKQVRRLYRGFHMLGKEGPSPYDRKSCTN